MWILHLEFHAVCPLWTYWSCLHMFLEIHRKASNIFNNQRLLGVCTIALMLSPSSMLSSSKVFFESNNRPSKEVSLKNARRNTCSEDRNLFSRGSLQIMLSCPSPMSHRKKQWQNLGPDFLSICCASFPPLRFEIYPIETGSLLVKPRSQNVDS